MNKRLTKHHRQILALLQKNARMTTAEIASRISLSESATSRKIKRMEMDGIFKASVEINHQALGICFTCNVLVKLASNADECTKAFIEKINKYREVSNCQLINAGFDFQFTTHTRDIEEFRAFYSKMSNQIGEIKDIQWHVVLNQVKSAALDVSYFLR